MRILVENIYRNEDGVILQLVRIVETHRKYTVMKTGKLSSAHIVKSNSK